MDAELIKTRRYGANGPMVVLLHGGPGAPGYMAEVGRNLAGRFCVLEPLQRRSDGDGVLSVEKHIDDLRDVMDFYCGGKKAALVGHSWGAMLALAFTAKFSEMVSSIVLIGCGTFDDESRKKLKATRKERMGDDFQRKLEELAERIHEADDRLAAMGKLIERIDSVELIEYEDESEKCDAKGHEETWNDMLRCQEEGIYPAAFGGISVPTLMIHGDYDPHPGEMIFENLRGYMPQLRYAELDRCGHCPWYERHARERFFEVLGDWLGRDGL